MNSLLLPASILLILFAVSNGMKDGSNVAATAISSLSLTRFKAVLVVALAEFIGPFFLGSNVAMTVSNNILQPRFIEHSLDTMLLLMSGIAGALIWNILTWWIKLPTSSSFSIVGGLIGPFIFRFGQMAIPWKIFFLKVILAMFISPILGLFIGFLFHDVTNLLLKNAHLKMNKYIKKLQVFTLIFLGANHGTNDSQKIMGILLLLLAASGIDTAGTIPFWVKLVSISAITLGVTLGGTKIIKTVGYRIFKIQPIHALESQLSASSILLACNILGAPVSTTQIISSSVMGVGSCHNSKLVRWQIIKDIFWSWLLTIPACALLSVLVYVIVSKIF